MSTVMDSQARCKSGYRIGTTTNWISNSFLTFPPWLSCAAALQPSFPELTGSMLAGGQKLRLQRLAVSHFLKAVH
jgi:hypothetical protein